jgi:hypothetical protein
MRIHDNAYHDAQICTIWVTQMKSILRVWRG